ncbi:Hypothetical protein, putative [Bodo saltans]|uniref:Uncharacterized protein n=1 Tax=Bodo saltans TaxID=75058 RepID=A0A0S4JAF9_BODSA|nr:Hypothetical protein, putative [Bodo saltans]|eukprot:CUG86436.1 Hypothetical protein, putative [Bodo saltans]
MPRAVTYNSVCHLATQQEPLIPFLDIVFHEKNNISTQLHDEHNNNNNINNNSPSHPLQEQHFHQRYFHHHDHNHHNVMTTPSFQFNNNHLPTTNGIVEWETPTSLMGEHRLVSLEIPFVTATSDTHEALEEDEVKAVGGERRCGDDEMLHSHNTNSKNNTNNNVVVDRSPSTATTAFGSTNFDLSPLRSDDMLSISTVCAEEMAELTPLLPLTSTTRQARQRSCDDDQEQLRSHYVLSLPQITTVSSSSLGQHSSCSSCVVQQQQQPSMTTTGRCREELFAAAASEGCGGDLAFFEDSCATLPTMICSPPANCSTSGMLQWPKLLALDQGIPHTMRRPTASSIACAESPQFGTTQTTCAAKHLPPTSLMSSMVLPFSCRHKQQQQQQHQQQPRRSSFRCSSGESLDQQHPFGDGSDWCHHNHHHHHCAHDDDEYADDDEEVSLTSCCLTSLEATSTSIASLMSPTSSLEVFPGCAVVPVFVSGGAWGE